MLVLGIESTCDETAASIVRDGHEILSSVIFSQADLHAGFGGVFPEVASRAHIEAIVPVIKEAFTQAGIQKQEIDLIAVAKAPGLVGGLLIGVEAAKGLAMALNKPFVGVNHVEAHMYAAMMDHEPVFPSLGVVLSGGHTLLVKIDKIGSYDILGTTIDDALGEAFDKLAVMLGFAYPGGPMIEKLALSGRAKSFNIKAGKVSDKPLHFSYSGLKTACRTLIEKQQSLSDEFKYNLAATFQEVVIKDLVKKISLAAKEHQLTHVYLGGGVVCNTALRESLHKDCKDLTFHFAPKSLCVDNAAMIAGLGYHRYKLQNASDPFDLIPQTRTPTF